MIVTIGLINISQMSGLRIQQCARAIKLVLLCTEFRLLFHIQKNVNLRELLECSFISLLQLVIIK